MLDFIAHRSSMRHAAAAGRPQLRDLRGSLAQAGVFEPARGYHAVWLAVVLVMYAGCLAVLTGTPPLLLRLTAIVGAAIAVMQLGLFAHEVGHGAVTRRPRLRELLGQLTSSFLVGFGHSHWQSTHPVHHNHPNTERVDPDLDTGRHGYALYEASARAITSWLARFQPWTLVAALPAWGFVIRFVALVHAIRHFGRRTVIDLVCVAGHVALWTSLGIVSGSLGDLAIDYVAITALNGLYMGAILIIPHVGTGSRSAEAELPYFERQVLFSRNYDASWLGTLLCGGLNLQVEHHLLPCVPCVRLRRARPVIMAYCRRHRLPYRQVGYLQAWREVFAHLRRMAHLARTGQPDTEAVEEPRRAA